MNNKIQRTMNSKAMALEVWTIFQTSNRTELCSNNKCTRINSTRCFNNKRRCTLMRDQTIPISKLKTLALAPMPTMSIRLSSCKRCRAIPNLTKHKPKLKLKPKPKLKTNCSSNGKCLNNHQFRTRIFRPRWPRWAITITMLVISSFLRTMEATCWRTW